MTFEESVLADIDAVFFTMGESARIAIYNGVEIAVVTDNTFMQNTSVPGLLVQGQRIMVKASDVPKPKPGDKVIMSGVTWHVAGLPNEEGGVWSLDLDCETRTVGV